MGKNKHSKQKFISINEWDEVQKKRVEVVSKTVNINKSDLTKTPVEIKDECKGSIKDGIKIVENNELDSVEKEKSKNSNLLKNPETHTKLDDEKLEIDVPKSSISKKNEKINKDNRSNTKKGTFKNLENSMNNDKLDNRDKREHNNKLEAKSSISKNDGKSTIGENSKMNKKNNHGENKNDLKESLNERIEAGSHDITHSQTAKTDQNIREPRDTNQKACTDSNRTKTQSLNKIDSEVPKANKNRKSRHDNLDTHTDVSSHSRNTSLKNEKSHSHKQSRDKSNQKDKKDDIKSTCSDNKTKTPAYNKHKKDFLDDGNNVIVEIDEDLFNLSKDFCLAHCVAEDLRMGAGIAVEFKSYFAGVGKLLDQKLTVGDVGVVKRHDQIAFYLITKKNSSGKPTMLTLRNALCSLLKKMKELNLTKLGIPALGCGLDGLDWSEVKLLITQIFTGSGILITACIPSKIVGRKQAPPLKVYITPRNLWEMETETDIILFIDLDQFNKKNGLNDVETRVDTRYPFKENLRNDIKGKKLNPGDITQYVVKNEKIICVITSQTTHYSDLEEAFIKIKHSIKKYRYLAFQSGLIKPDDNFKYISRVVLILRSIINSSELWLCGDTNQSDVVVYDQYCKSILNLSSRNYSSDFNSSGPMDYNNKSTNNQNWRNNSLTNK